MEEKIKQLISEQLCVKLERVVPEARFVEDLRADSLDLIELVMCFEEDFNIEIPDEDAEQMDTVGKAIEYVKNKVSEGG